MKKVVDIPQPPLQVEQHHCDICDTLLDFRPTVPCDGWLFVGALSGPAYRLAEETAIIICPKCAPSARVRVLNK